MVQIIYPSAQIVKSTTSVVPNSIKNEQRRRSPLWQSLCSRIECDNLDAHKTDFQLHYSLAHLKNSTRQKISLRLMTMSATPVSWNFELIHTLSSPGGPLNFLQGASALSLLGISIAVCLPLLIILGFDFFDHWLQKRLVRGLPLVQDRAYLSPCFRPQPSTLDPNEALQTSYYKVGLLQDSVIDETDAFHFHEQVH